MGPMERFLKKLWTFSGLLISLFLSQGTLEANPFFQQAQPILKGSTVASAITAVGDTGIRHSKTVIPLVLSSDNNYVPQMYTTMLSIFKNSSKNAFYDFHLLVPSNFEQRYKDEITKLGDKHDNCRITFIDMGSKLSDTKTGKFPPAASYRLMAADLLPNYDKCLYMDVDIIVLGNLAELYNINIDNYYIAGVKDTIFLASKRLMQYAISELNIHPCINSGVLLMNLELIRRDGLTERLVDAATYGLGGKKPSSFPDQDALNKVCCGKIKFIDPRYNLHPWIFFRAEKSPEFRGNLEASFTEDQLREARDNPCILHFAGTKPWAKPASILHSDTWWEYARQTPFYEEILYKNIAIKVLQDLDKVLQELITKEVRIQLQEQLKKMGNPSEEEE
jgi:lipopolysaccharide biosynthesis glycosyltransferase